MSASQLCFLCFAVFLTRLYSTQAEGNSFPVFISRHNNNTLTYDSGFSNNTRCSWNCTIIDSNFPKQWNTVSTKHRLIKLVVEYEKKVTEQCVKQASRNSSGNATEYFSVWLPPNNKPSNFDHAVQRVLDLFFSSNTEERVKVKAACAFRPLKTRSAEPAFLNLNDYFLSQSVRSHLADHGFNVKRSNDCSAEEMSNLQPCITMSNSTVNSNDSHFIQLPSVWLHYGSALVTVFATAFMYYSPAYICIFSPTVIAENGLRSIVLEGASPVSFRSFVGNYFHSGCDTWHWARMLFLRLVLLPLPFLPSLIVFDRLRNRGKLFQFYSISNPFLIVCLICYVIQAIHSSFFKTVSQKVKPCYVCRFVKTNCDGEPRRRVINHLRMQPLILLKCWRFFRKYLKLYYFKMSHVILPARNMAQRQIHRLAGFLVFLSTIPFVTIILFAAMLVVDILGIIFTAPLNVLLFDHIMASSEVSSRSLLNRFPVYRPNFVVRIFLRGLSTLGASLLLLFSALGVVIVIAVLFILLLFEESLPFVILFVLVCYYLWSSYSSFTNKYHDLSLILFKCYQEHRHDQISNEKAAAATADPTQEAERTPNPENEGSVIKIPKELFDTACEELMPIRESICVLGLKVVLILSFVFLVFAVVMVFHVGATPMMRALVTFLTGSLPRIVAIYIDGARKRKLETMVIEERAPGIVQRYVKGSSSIDQENDSFGTNTGEVIFVDENKEVIQLVNMKK